MKVDKPIALLIYGLSGSGKTTLAKAITEDLKLLGVNCHHLDGDDLRSYVPWVGYSVQERLDSARLKASHIKVLLESGVSSICSFTLSMHEQRQIIKDACSGFKVIECFIDCPLEVCEKRDPKGLYAKRRKEEVLNVVGIDFPFEKPNQAEITISPSEESHVCAKNKVIEYLKTSGVIVPSFKSKSFNFKKGFLAGRFQPFHREHLRFALMALKECSHLLIGVTQPFPGVLSEGGGEREFKKSNPLPYWLRAEIIESCLVDSGVEKTRFSIIPAPLISHVLSEIISQDVVIFNSVVEEWNKKKEDIFSATQRKVVTLNPGPKTISGQEIREKILNRDDSWESDVPKIVFDHFRKEIVQRVLCS